MKIENAQRKIIRAIFSGNKIETLCDILQVQNLYIVEMLEELFEELRGESPFGLLQPNELSEQCI